MAEKTFWYHFASGLTIRLLLSIYSEFHDIYCSIRYTDIDYKVFSDAAKQVVEGDSPYHFQPYRYTPLIAYLLVPNYYLHPVFGKLLFAVIDAVVAYSIYYAVLLIYQNERKATQCAKLWLYNPFSIIIATRGNVDCFSALLVLSTLILHLQEKYILSGLLLGIATHFRLYPILFLMPLLFTAGSNKLQPFISPLYKLLFPVKEKLLVLAGFLISLSLLTYGFYYTYGNAFLQQSILYHVNRTDIRHNFSVYFYSQYLNYAWAEDITHKLLLSAPLFAALLAIYAKYNLMKHLPFNFFCTTFILVTFNKVLTCQYHIWYLSLLPLFLPSISLSKNQVITLVASWILSQAVWLSFAFILEFQGINSFIYLWISSVVYLISNIFVLTTFIKSYNEANVKSKLV